MQRQQPSSSADSPETPEGVFGGRVRDERRDMSLTQTDLAELVSERLGIKVHSTTITKIEKGTQGVGLNEAVAIAAALDVDLAVLLAPPAGMDAAAALAQAEAQLRDLEAQEQVIAAERQVAAARVERLRAIVNRKGES